MPDTRLELVWPGKDQFLLTPSDETGAPVWVNTDHPAAHEVRISTFTGAQGEVNLNDPYGDNLLFTGDGLHVLRILNEVPEYRKHYRGKVKLIYLDPPFNTGQMFDHYDDWMEHSTWLSFMRDRLLLMQELLAPDGTIWMHLDNYEVHRMRCVMDEVFGAPQYLNTVVWKRTSAKSAAQRGMGTMYDNMLVYGAGDQAQLRQILMPYSTEYLRTKYNNVDERGVYQLGDLTASGLRNGDSGLPWQGYDPAQRGNHWRAPSAEQILGEQAATFKTREKLDALLEAGYIQLPAKPGGAPRFKRYLNDEGGISLGDLWIDVNVINSQGDERVGYNTQKPEELVARVITMASSPGDIVLDPFAGSGTTAAAAHKLGRRWITAEILPTTVEAFTLPRLQTTVDGSDRAGISTRVTSTPANDLPDGTSTDDFKATLRALAAMREAGHLTHLDDEAWDALMKPLRANARQKHTTTDLWSGGGGFRTVEVGPSMYEVTPVGVLLADWATNGAFARAVAGQLGFTFQPDTAPLCGVRGRMRLAVIDGAVGVEEVSTIVEALDDAERVTIVAKVILPDAEKALTDASRGSRIRKAPRDVLLDDQRRRRRHNTTTSSGGGL